MLLNDQSMLVESSNLLLPLHSIGYVTDDVEFALEKIGDEYFVVVATGNYYQVYDLDQLRIKYMSCRMRNKIDILTTKYEMVYIAMGKVIEGYNRYEKVFELNEHKSKVKGILVLGELLITWDKDLIIISDLSTHRLINKLVLDLDTSDEIISVLHPITYLNKILIVTSRNCELWNINTNKMIYRFNSIQKMLFTNSNLKTPLNDYLENNKTNIISATCSSTHPDVIGIGIQSGILYTLDIANDIILSSLEHLPEQKGITSMSFCTEKPILVSGCENGDLVIWDLENARALNTIESAHESRVVKVQFVQGTSIFVTSGADNSIIEYIVDNQNTPPRELRCRRGHISSIKKALFYNALPEKSRDLLCISNSKNSGYLGKISTIQQHQNRIFSQNSLKKRFNEKYQFPFRRLPPVIDIAFSESRHFDWPNIVTIHQGLHETFIWSGHNFALTPRVLTLEDVLKSNNNKQSKFNYNQKLSIQGLTSKKRDLPFTKAISVSSCGNYVVIGYSNAKIHRFNLQSGIHSGEFCFSLDTKIHFQSLNILSLHISQSTVVLCVSRDLNNYYLSSWSMKPIKHMNTSIVSARISSSDQEPFLSKMFGYLIAFGFSNGRVILYDFQSQIVSREFNCSHSIVDITISSDNKWIVISTSSSELFIYDIISSNLLDWIKFSSPAICCLFDHSDAFLITSHEQSNGSLSIWANKYALSISIEEGISKPPTKPFLIEDPPNKILDSENFEDSNNNRNLIQSDNTLQIESDLPEKGDVCENRKLISFSGVPFSTQQAILYIDEIKQRNKPIEPLRKPESAPFFLPNTSDFSKAVHKSAKIEENGRNEAREHLISKQTFSLLKTELQQILAGISVSDNDSMFSITKLLKSKSPSGVNFLLRQLGPLSGGSLDEIAKMIRYFNFSILNRTDSDLIQTYLNVFLTIHSITIIENRQNFQDIKDEIQCLNNIVKKDWNFLQNCLQNITCFVKFVTNIQMD